MASPIIPPISELLPGLATPLNISEERHALLYHAASDCCDLLAEVAKRCNDQDDRVTYSLALRSEMLVNLIAALTGGGDEGCVEHYGIAAYGHLFKVNHSAPN